MSLPAISPGLYGYGPRQKPPQGLFGPALLWVSAWCGVAPDGWEGALQGATAERRRRAGGYSFALSLRAFPAWPYASRQGNTIEDFPCKGDGTRNENTFIRGNLVHCVNSQ